MIDERKQNSRPGIPGWLPAWCIEGCLYTGLFLLICGAKFWLIDGFGNATPYWDQWISEVRMIKAYMEGTLTPALFFQSHNEHRIVFSQLLLIGLFRANGIWDPILQMVAQAPLHALAVVAFVALAGKSMSNAGKTALAGFAGGLGSVPFGWENTLWGDQSCFYFSMLFAIAVIWQCLRHEALTPRWWLGAFLGFASLFALANGTFSLIAIAAFLAARVILERGKEWKRRVAGIAVMGAIAAFGVGMTPRVPNHQELVAANFRSFLGALTGILSWPCDSHWAWIVIQAPLVLLVLGCLIRRVPFSDARWFLVVTGLFFWLQALATAYKRCQGWTASRYCDSWGMLLVVLCACLYYLPGIFGKARRFPALLAIAVWLVVCGYGMLDRAVNVLPFQLADRRTDMMEMENNVREYLGTGNPAWLQGKIPFPRPNDLRAILDTRSIRSVLPPNLINRNTPLSPESQKSARGGFTQNGYSSGTPALDKPILGSYGKGKDAKSGVTLLFKVPRGTRQVDLQVAGYPNARGIALKIEEEHRASRSIAPHFDPGDHWQTISVRLSPKTTSFKISAKDQSEGGWIAFSMPTVSSDGPPGRWARWLADNALYFADLGLVLLSLGGLGEIAARETNAELIQNPHG